MVKAIEKPAILLKMRRWICMCVRKRHLPDDLRERIRPLILGRLACWCDRSDTP